MEILDKFGDSVSVGDLVTKGEYIFQIEETMLKDNEVYIRGEYSYKWIKSTDCTKLFSDKDNYINLC